MIPVSNPLKQAAYYFRDFFMLGERDVRSYIIIFPAHSSLQQYI